MSAGIRDSLSNPYKMHSVLLLWQSWKCFRKSLIEKEEEEKCVAKQNREMLMKCGTAFLNFADEVQQEATLPERLTNSCGSPSCKRSHKQAKTVIKGYAKAFFIWLPILRADKQFSIIFHGEWDVDYKIKQVISQGGMVITSVQGQAQYWSSLQKHHGAECKSSSEMKGLCLLVLLNAVQHPPLARWSAQLISEAAGGMEQKMRQATGFIW